MIILTDKKSIFHDEMKCFICRQVLSKHTERKLGLYSTHSIFKRHPKSQHSLCKNILVNGYGRTWCKYYEGMCPEDNYCPRLKNPRGGDFGWAECIYIGKIKE